MATSVIGKIIRFERVYNRKKDARSAYAMALSYYLGYAISGQKELLHKAGFVLQQSGQEADLSLSFMRCFVAYESENFDLLNDLMATLRSRKNAMKNHQPTFYAIYLYFDCLLSLVHRKEKAATKGFRLLKDFCKDNAVYGAELLLANLSLTFNERTAAFNYLYLAYKKGERSPLFYVCLARAFAETSLSGREGELILPLIKWALNTGCRIDGIITMHQQLAQQALRKNQKIAEELHAATSLDWVLQIIVTSRMTNNDLSQEAFLYYKEAEARQLFFPQLHDFLIRSAHRNNIEDISSFTLAQYLKQEAEIGQEFLPFVYHLVLKGKLVGRHDELAAAIKPEIVRFACYCLDNNLYGRYYYSLYKYLLDLHATDVGVMKVDKKYLTAAKDVVKNLLFAHDIQISNATVKKVLIQEDFKKGEVVLEPKDGRARVNLWSPNARITCFEDDAMRNIIDCKVSISRLVDTADAALYKRLYEDGFSSPELLISLASFYIADTGRPLDAKATVLLNKAKQAGIDRIFLKQINAALGNYYAKQGDFAQAVEFFKDLDVSQINKDYLEQILLAYISAGDFNLAASLIIRHGGEIRDKSVFLALKQMARAFETLDHKRGLAAVAAKMMTRGWFDSSLMDIVLKHHACSISGWVELAKALTNLGIFEMRLHQKILDMAILTRNHTRFVQSIFAEMAEKAIGEQIVNDFALYLCYEVMANSAQLEKTTILAMESVYNKINADLLAYALAHCYIRQSGFATEKSRNILSLAIGAAKKSDIVFPIFKEIKDKTLMTAYIEKNRSFVHRTGAGRKVALHYRFDGGEFFESPMQYLAFGLYYCHIPHFYGEEIEYYFCEMREKGSIKTTPSIISNRSAHVLENEGDLYYTINNALIFEQMFKYERVEEIVTTQLSKKVGIRAKMM